MSELFLEIVNRSIAASWIVIAVLILRFCLKKAPKWVNVLLWGIVAVRLIFPFSIESALSLIPSAETVSPSIMMETAPSVQTGVPALDQVINPERQSAADMDLGHGCGLARRSRRASPLFRHKLLASAPQSPRSRDFAG